MNHTERVAVALKGAMLWGQWVYLQQYAGAVASDVAKQLAKDAQKQWQNWRDTQEPRMVSIAISMAKIANEFVILDRK